VYLAVYKNFMEAIDGIDNGGQAVAFTRHQLALLCCAGGPGAAVAAPSIGLLAAAVCCCCSDVLLVLVLLPLVALSPCAAGAVDTDAVLWLQG
jgi:hypothetical protein